MLPSRILAAPFLFWSLGALYWAWQHDGIGAAHVAAPLAVAAAIFVMGPQIDWAYWQRYPPDLPAQWRDFLEKRFIFYQKQPENERFQFRSRTFLFLQSVDWMAKGFGEDEAVPDDLKLLIAARGALLTRGRLKPLIPKFETVIFYPEPFHTPDYPFFHASELYEPDGALIFSAKHVLAATAEPGRFFDVAFYELGRAFSKNFPDAGFPVFDETAWSRLELASGFSKAFVEASVGLPDAEALGAAIHHHFVFAERFKAVFPVESARFAAIFGQKPS